MSTATKLDIRAQGRELEGDIELQRTPLVSRVTPAATPISGPQETLVGQEPARARSVRRGLPDILEEVSEEREKLVPLNVRVSDWVATAIDNKVLAIKMSGRKIKKEKVVETALIQALGLVKPE